MDSVELVKTICKKRKIPISKLETTCNFGNGYIRKLKEGKFPSDRLIKIADFLGVTTDYLLGNTIISICPICGFGDDPLSEQSKKEHELFHQRFLKIKEKYPFFKPYLDADKERTDSIFAFRRYGNSLDEKMLAFEKYLQSSFSLEINRNNYNIDNLDYKEFCKVEVSSLHEDDCISKEFMDALIDKYGVDRNFLSGNEYLLARASNNEQLMRLLAYAEKLNPEMLNMLEIQAKALSEQAEKNEE